VARASGAVKVATGHNLDDQAETVLLRLVRGAGMDGLGGIPPVNRKGNLTLVRPLIEVSRAAILDFLKREEKEFRTDKSNADLKYRRNFVRHELIPKIEQEWNPAVKTILARCAAQHRDVYDYIEEEAKRWWNRAVRCETKRATLKGGVLKKASPFMRQEIVKRVLRKLAPASSERFHFEHLAQTAKLLTQRATQPRISLPDGVFVEKSGKDLVISVGD
jgi:tRNA(Ile)-lysidine synthase